MGRDHSYWHTAAAHYAVVPNAAAQEGTPRWRLVAFTRAGDHTLHQGERADCCRALALLRDTGERGIAS